MFSSSRVLLFPLPRGSVNFGPMCESLIMGKCLGFFNVDMDIQGFVSNPYQPPALFEPACGLNCTAFLKERQEAPAKHLCSFSA